MSTATAAALEDVIDALQREAATALAWAEQYKTSKKQGERNSVHVYCRRAETALLAEAPGGGDARPHLGA
jgi:hypothetical protein